MERFFSANVTAIDKIFSFVYFFCVLVAFIIGLRKVCLRDGPTYFKLFICAVGCHALEALGDFVNVLCGGFGEYLNISNLSFYTFTIFVVFANIGPSEQSEGISIPKSRKATLLALIAPIALVGLLVPVWNKFFLQAHTLWKISSIVELIPVFLGAYFSLRQLLAKNDSNGFLKLTKPVNFCVLLTLCLDVFSYYYSFLPSPVSYIISLCIVIALFGIVFTAIKGAEKWKTLV